MRTGHSIPRALKLHPLVAACLGVLVASGAGGTERNQHPNGAVVVQNCLDSGPGSLRDAVASAGPGDPIDLTHLACSQISLTTSRIDLAQSTLLQGPGSGLLTISGPTTDRVFDQNTPGATLAIYGMTITHGYGFLSGGCIYSRGPVQLNDTVVSGCKLLGEAGTSNYVGGGIYAQDIVFAINSRVVDNEVYSSLGGAIGGGIASTGDVVLMGSTVSGNRAESASGSGVLSSGGIDAGGAVTLAYSTVADNAASGLTPHEGTGGGVRAVGVVTIQNSTISGNSAGASGGLDVYGHNSTSGSLVSNSTISGNTAGGSIGGLYVRGDVTIQNSTIAFNTEHYDLGAGLRVAYGLADLESTIIASNSGDNDTINVGTGVGGGVTGANDLIGPSGATTLPPGTLQSDPRLGSLADNGGPTKTQALGSGSPAINAGNNSAGLSTDQRGPGFARVQGAAVDIGAIEFDPDLIFADGFD